MLNEVIETDIKYTARRAIIFVRVSSKDQEDGYSIDAQKHRLENYCSRRNLVVDKVFELVESSTIGDRRKFMSMVKYAEHKKETIAIVVDKVDRLQRSLREYPLLDKLVLEGKIELHFNSENYVIHKHSKSQDRQAWSLGVVMAQGYVDSLRDNVKRSINHKIRLGEWIGIAPIGYLNARDERGRSIVVVDPERAPLVKKLFEEYSKGACTVSELTNKVQQWGLQSRLGKGANLRKNRIYDILNNPFYYGCMKIKETIYLHCYPPLIEKSLFDKCQSLLKGWHLKPYKHGIHEFAFRGILTCGISDKTVSSDKKRKKYVNGNFGEWTYLRCGHPDKPGKLMWVREDVVLAQVVDILKKFQIPKNMYGEISSYIKSSDKEDLHVARNQIGILNRERDTVVSRIDALLDLLLDQKINKEEFDIKRNKLQSLKAEIESKILRFDVSKDRFADKLNTLIYQVSNICSEFAGSQVHRKRELLIFMFANLTLKGSKLLYSLKKPFEMFQLCHNTEEWLALVDRLRTDPDLRSLILTLPSIEIIEEKPIEQLEDQH